MPRTANPRHWSRAIRRADESDCRTDSAVSPPAFAIGLLPALISRGPSRLPRHGAGGGGHAWGHRRRHRRLCQVPLRRGKPRPLLHLADGPVLLLVAVIALADEDIAVGIQVLEDDAVMAGNRAGLIGCESQRELAFG